MHDHEQQHDDHQQLSSTFGDNTALLQLIKLDDADDANKNKQQFDLLNENGLAPSAIADHQQVVLFEINLISILLHSSRLPPPPPPAPLTRWSNASISIAMAILFLVHYPISIRVERLSQLINCSMIWQIRFASFLFSSQ
jgi:hypothetical protein